MSDRASTNDPFAGYKPVKVSSVGDVAELPPAKACGRKHRFKKRAEGEFSKTAKFVGWSAFTVVAITLVAFVAYGFIYEAPVGDGAAELTTYTNHLQKLSDVGQKIRGKVRKTTDVILPGKAVAVTNPPPESVVTNSPPPVAAKPEPREIDPELKRFRGGRSGRTLGAPGPAKRRVD